MSQRMTVGWDRGEQIGFMPPNSEVVYPDPMLTVAWVPLTTATILDYDPADMVVSPGGGSEEPGGGGSDETSPTAGGEAAEPQRYGRPRILVTKRRSEKLFLRDGLFVDVTAPAPARVRAVLRARVPRATDGGQSRLVNLTRVLTAELGTQRRRLVLRPAASGRRALGSLDRVAAELRLVVRYEGQEPIRLERTVTIVDR